MPRVPLRGSFSGFKGSIWYHKGFGYKGPCAPIASLAIVDQTPSGSVGLVVLGLRVSDLRFMGL